MSGRQKLLTYATGFILGCLVLALIPREDEKPQRHPWHAQTAVEGTYPMTVTDDTGREVTFEKQPRHFISLAPSVTEILFAMDMGDHLMAVTKWCTFPEEARVLKESGAHVGSMDQPNREAIAAYRPDLILGTDLTPPDIYRAVENPPRTIAFALEHKSMDDILEDVKIVGTITGVPGKALALVNRLRNEKRAVEESLSPFLELPKRRVLFLLSIEDDSQPGWAPGEDAWVTNLIESAHAINVASELGKAWGEVSFEALLALDPEVLLLREADSPEAQARMEAVVKTLPEHPVWRQVPAVQNGRIHWIPNGPLSIPGPRVMQAYASIAGAIWE